ncbi:MAG TPA: hypothetical protein VM690_07005, partial [Gaiellaceae bacterium]|nr:hypothetical protein [Gaiellaceae bacterium]
MSAILVTGFEPFGGSAVNPSQKIVEALDGVVLPVSYERAADALRVAIREHEPELVISFGQAERAYVSVERFALNLDGAGNVDNEGASSAAPIDPDGPA